MATGLFATPSQLIRAKELSGQQQDFATASLPAGRVAVAFASNLGRTVGDAVPRLFGFAPAQERLAQARQDALSKAHQVAGNDPVKFLSAASKALMGMGDFQGAVSLIDKLQQVRATNAEIGATEATAGLRGAQAENVRGQFEHESQMQQEAIEAEQRKLDKKLGVDTAIEGAKLNQASQQFRIEQLQKIRDLDIKAQRANSYEEFVDAKANYWEESLRLKAQQLALKKQRNKSLNATDEFRKLQAEAVKDYRKAITVQAARKLLSINPDALSGIDESKLESMDARKLLNRLPPKVRETLTTNIQDFFGKIQPMQRLLRESLEGQGGGTLPSENDIVKFTGTSANTGEESDLFIDLMNERE